MPFFPRCFLTGNPARRCAVASDQASYRSLPRLRESSFTPLIFLFTRNHEFRVIGNNARSLFRDRGGLFQFGRSFCFLTVSYRKIPPCPVYPGCRKKPENSGFSTIAEMTRFVFIRRSIDQGGVENVCKTVCSRAAEGSARGTKIDPGPAGRGYRSVQIRPGQLASWAVTRPDFSLRYSDEWW